MISRQDWIWTGIQKPPTLCNPNFDLRRLYLLVFHVFWSCAKPWTLDPMEMLILPSETVSKRRDVMLLVHSIPIKWEGDLEIGLLNFSCISPCPGEGPLKLMTCSQDRLRSTDRNTRSERINWSWFLVSSTKHSPYLDNSLMLRT